MGYKLRDLPPAWWHVCVCALCRWAFWRRDHAPDCQQLLEGSAAYRSSSSEHAIAIKTGTSPPTAAALMHQQVASRAASLASPRSPAGGARYGRQGFPLGNLILHLGTHFAPAAVLHLGMHPENCSDFCFRRLRYACPMRHSWHSPAIPLAPELLKLVCFYTTNCQLQGRCFHLPIFTTLIPLIE